MLRIFLVTLAIFGVFLIANQAQGSNAGGDGGGYTQLPQCSYARLGQMLYVQGYLWRCVHDPIYAYHWVQT